MHVTCHDEAKRSVPVFFRLSVVHRVSTVVQQNSSSTWFFDSYDSIRLVESFEDTGLRKDGFMMTSEEFSDVVQYSTSIG